MACEASQAAETRAKLAAGEAVRVTRAKLAAGEAVRVKRAAGEASEASKCEASEAKRAFAQRYTVHGTGCKL